MAPVTLKDILAARETRAALREELRQTSGLPVLTFSINCPGPTKDSDSIRSLLRYAVDCFRELAAAHDLFSHEERFFYPPTGPFVLLAIAGDATQFKRLAAQIEDLPEYGRLLDIDVYDSDGQQLSRTQFGLPIRSCFLCEDDAITCMRQGRHSAADLQQEFQRRLAMLANRGDESWPPQVWETGHWAIESMLMEAACTPAPGLVDRTNSGAHNDMDFFTFMTSTSALASTMTRCAAAGWRHIGPASELLPQLRHIGCEGERRMFHATRGVNTQKGLVFLMGLLCASAALIRKNSAVLTAEAICRGVAGICDGIVQRELAPLLEKIPSERPVTAGERLYLEYRTTGIRGEAERGLPSVLQHGLPALRQSLAHGLSINDALVHTLIHLMAVVEDTTVLHRHNPATLLEVQSQAEIILGLGGMFTPKGISAIEQLDIEFIRRWISPGGCADLLAAVYFLHLAETSSSNGLVSMP